MTPDEEPSETEYRLLPPIIGELSADQPMMPTLGQTVTDSFDKLDVTEEWRWKLDPEPPKG